MALVNMSSHQFLLKQAQQQFLSPAKVFAKLKSKVEREEKFAKERLLETRKKPGTDFNTPSKKNGRVGADDTEVQALTLSPILSPQKNCRYSDGSTSLVKTIQEEPPPSRTTDGRESRRVLVDQPDNVFSPFRSRLRKRKQSPPEFYKDFCVSGRKTSAESEEKSSYVINTNYMMDNNNQVSDDQSEVNNELRIPPSKHTDKQCSVFLHKYPVTSAAQIFACMRERDLQKRLPNNRMECFGRNHQDGEAGVAGNALDVFSDETTNCKLSEDNLSTGNSSEDASPSNPLLAAKYANIQPLTRRNSDVEKHQAGFNPRDIMVWETCTDNDVEALTLSLISSPQKSADFSDLENESQTLNRIPPTSEPEILPSRRGRAPLESTTLSQAHISNGDGFKVSSRMFKNADRAFDEAPPLNKPSSQTDMFSPIKSRLRKRNLAQKDYSGRGESSRQEESRKLSAVREEQHPKTSPEDRGCARVLPEPRIPHLERCGNERKFTLMSPAKTFAFMKEQENQRLLRRRPTNETPGGRAIPPPTDVPVPPEPTVADRDHVTVTANRSVGPTVSQSDSSPEEDPPPAAPPLPVLLEDPLVLNSPRICIPQKTEFKRNTWPKQIQFPAESVTYLKKWFLRTNKLGLFVEGIHREENIYWNSSIIMDRVSSLVLKTVSGRVYILLGKMNMDRTSDFPRWILIKFAKGFPANWKALYEKFLSESKGRTRKCINGGSNTQKTPAAKADDHSVRQNGKRSPPSSASRSNVSRSGRVIKPPLEYWKGGRVILDAYMNVTIHESYDVSMCNAEVSSSVLQEKLHVKGSNVNDSRQSRATTKAKESLRLRKVRAHIPPPSRSKAPRVSTAEKPAPVKPAPVKQRVPRTSSHQNAKKQTHDATRISASNQANVDSAASEQTVHRGNKTQRNQIKDGRSKPEDKLVQDKTVKAKNGSRVSPPEPEDHWTKEELHKLREAVSYYPKHMGGYWDRVSLMVGTRSAEECHHQHTSQETAQPAAPPGTKNDPTKKKKKKKEEAAAKTSAPPLITARAGTLKRKQQVRQFLDALPSDDLDDVFSTVYMQKKRFEMPSLCPSEDHNLSMSDMDPQTPRPTCISEAKTPQCLHITPGMMGSPSRSIDDKYVYQLQKRMKKNRFNVCKHLPPAKKLSPTPSVKRTLKRCGNTENDSFVVWQMFPGNDAVLSDTGEEEDFYFSDNDL